MNIYKIFFQHKKTGEFSTLLNKDKDKYEHNLAVIKKAEAEGKASLIISGITKEESDLENYYRLAGESK